MISQRFNGNCCELDKQLYWRRVSDWDIIYEDNYFIMFAGNNFKVQKYIVHQNSLKVQLYTKQFKVHCTSKQFKSTIVHWTVQKYIVHLNSSKVQFYTKQFKSTINCTLSSSKVQLYTKQFKGTMYTKQFKSTIVH